MLRYALLPTLTGALGGALLVVSLFWLTGQIGSTEGQAAPAQSEPLLSAIDAISVVRQVRGDSPETGPGLMHDVLLARCYPEEPDWRAVFLYDKWEVTARCTAMSQSPVWIVTEPELHILPYTNAAGLLTQ